MGVEDFSPWALAGNAIGSIGGAIIQNEIGKANEKRQWDEYYSPKAQVRNLAAAGINPAVAFGNQSPVLTSGGQMQMPDVSNLGLGTTALSEIGSYLNAKANAEKAGVETEGTVLDNQVKRQTFDELVKKVGIENNWTKEQTAKISQEIGLMSGQFNELQQRIENMRSEKKLTDKSVAWFDRHMSAEIAHLMSSAEYQNSLKGLTDSQKQLLDDTMEDLKDITSYQADQMSKVVDLLEKYGDAQSIVGMISEVVGSASDLINSIGGLKNLNRVQEVLSTSTTTDSKGNTKVTRSRSTRSNR